jgi:acyl-CoA reductase-like NAD-dependent aldehyde dehydrogenase
VLKPAEQTPLSALRLGELMLNARLPAGVVNVVTGFGDAGAALDKDADMDVALPGAANGIFFNQGQCCNAGSRLSIERDVSDEVVQGISDEATKIRVGPGLDPDTIPFASEDDDVIARGNDTNHGLASGIWTRDINKAHRTAHRLRAGTVWIGCYSARLTPRCRSAVTRSRAGGGRWATTGSRITSKPSPWSPSSHREKGRAMARRRLAIANNG